MGNGGVLSRQLLVVVVVLGAIAFLAALFIFIQTIRRRRRQSAPLPPVQPLAHHRLTKQDHELLPSEPASPMYNSIPSSVGSTTPLIHMQDSRLLSPSPTPGFASPPSNLSAVSLATTDSPNSTLAARTQAYNTLTQHKARPMSMSSVPSGTISRRGSRSTLRGVPHGPHSQVEIILPTPLSPQLNRRTSQGGYSTRHENTSADRMSIADQWIAPRSLAAPSSPSPRHSRQMTAPPSSYVPPSNLAFDSVPPVPALPLFNENSPKRSPSREGFRTG